MKFRIPCVERVAVTDCGQRFGRLTTIETIERRKGADVWFCLCDCGVIVEVPADKLRSGNTRSCGCLKRQAWPERRRAECSSGADLSLYQIWNGMIRRCHGPRIGKYKNYSGRGIEVCPEWRASFERFKQDVGPRPSPNHSIDRINNDGNYEPGNVRWATAKEQARNCRRNRWATIDGRTQTVVDWATELGIDPPNRVYVRISNGWSPERALTVPFARVRKLTPAQADEIRARAQSGSTPSSLAREFGMACGSIRDVLAGRTWANGGAS